ncbi:MAG: hypothetical protein JXR51_05185 [Bacteroidales bacterium]|nr:hypothetical protein [Bacteroidales bacterium]MBN2756553.1 hypothetical protein [Bacteroidales bacterium]
MKGENERKKELEELDKKLIELKKNMPEGMVQITDPNEIVYHFSVKPEIDRIVNAKHKNINDIEDTLINMLDFYEETGLGKDEVFILIEMLNEFDEKLSDKYMILYGKAFEKINNNNK